MRNYNSCIKSKLNGSGKTRLNRTPRAISSRAVACVILMFALTPTAQADAEYETMPVTIDGKSYTLALDEESAWQLMLVNPWNKIPDDYDVELKQLKNDQAVDVRCYPDLQDMIDDCRAEGLSPLITSSYRTIEKQRELFDNRVERIMNEGHSRRTAVADTRRVVAEPGTSEHQLGLALDIVDENHQLLDSSQESTKVQQWLIENSWKYGFILRYPSDKSDITGIIYEPWHYRYVGKEAAKEIHEREICLEEYLEFQPH